MCLAWWATTPSGASFCCAVLLRLVGGTWEAHLLQPRYTCAAIAATAATATPRHICREGFVQALLLIFFSEIGDKTFFIALLLALQQPRRLVFVGTFGALAVMTVISVGLGRVLHLLDEVCVCARVYVHGVWGGGWLG